MPRPISPARRFATLRHLPSRAALTAVTIRSRSSWRQRGVHRQREHFAGGRLRLGQVRGDVEGRQPVVGHRVVHAGADVVFLAQRGVQAVAVLRRPARCTGGRRARRRRRPAACRRRRGWRQERGISWRCCGPAADLGQLDPADRGVQVGHAGVEAHQLVLVLASPCPGCAAAAALRSTLGVATSRPCRLRPRSCSWSGTG